MTRAHRPAGGEECSQSVGRSEAGGTVVAGAGLADRCARAGRAVGAGRDVVQRGGLAARVLVDPLKLVAPGAAGETDHARDDRERKRWSRVLG